MSNEYDDDQGKETPAEQPAPSLAEDLAALRREIDSYASLTGAVVDESPGMSKPTPHAYELAIKRNRMRASITERLDRIAAQQPQPATGPRGSAMTLHTCGSITYGAHDELCHVCHKPGTWRALYTLGEAPDS